MLCQVVVFTAITTRADKKPRPRMSLLVPTTSHSLDTKFKFCYLAPIAFSAKRYRIGLKRCLPYRLATQGSMFAVVKAACRLISLFLSLMLSNKKAHKREAVLMTRNSMNNQLYFCHRIHIWFQSHFRVSNTLFTKTRFDFRPQLTKPIHLLDSVMKSTINSINHLFTDT